MSPMQQMFLGLGAVATKTYVDDVFSTYLYTGNQTARSFNTGIDMSEGGMTWIKNRSGESNHALYDTERGVTKEIISDSNAAETTQSTGLTAFNSNGFSLGADSGNRYNQNSTDYASWTFRKAKGFFDVVSWSGDGSGDRVLSHNLGCIPGMIILKATSTTSEWYVYHRGVGEDKYLELNDTAAEASFSGGWTGITASQFPVKSGFSMNASGHTYIAYLFAGGESTAATARSVVFDGNDYLSLAASDDFHLTGDFTLEWWCKRTSTGTSPEGIFEIGNYNTSGGVLIYTYQSKLWIYQDGTDNDYASALPPVNQWCHYAIVRSGSTNTIYLNGVAKGNFTNSNDWGSSTNKTFRVASNYGSNFIGNISNVRLVKGTAVYTSLFKPPTEPLTSITNTTLLCCNNSSTTGKTTGGTITANGDPTASTDSPFDDPAAFTFGDAGDQNVIKCGSYLGNTDYDVFGTRVIDLGWEPAFVMYKNASSTGNWEIFDNMRGFLGGTGDSAMLEANTSDAEEAAQRISITPTGFKDPGLITTGDTVIYVAIRRPDGYVGKPPELGTGVFAMDTGNGSSTIPNFDSGFPVDFGITRKPAASDNWAITARLTQGSYLYTDLTNAEAAWAAHSFDSNAGIYNWNGYNTDYQTWMWKRHAGFDVVTYTGGGTGQTLSHSLNAVPEMIWVKCRSGAHDWAVYHKGLNGGTNPEQKYLVLNSNAAEVDNSNRWGDTAPTATTFTVGGANSVGDGSATYLAMLFASVDGISKVGYYDGSNSVQTITTGFQPRMLIVKRTDDTGNWYLFDTVRGWGSGNDKPINLASSSAELTYDGGAPTSTGFTLSVYSEWNQLNDKYIYYAHS